MRLQAASRPSVRSSKPRQVSVTLAISVGWKSLKAGSSCTSRDIMPSSASVMLRSDAAISTMAQTSASCGLNWGGLNMRPLFPARLVARRRGDVNSGYRGVRGVGEEAARFRHRLRQPQAPDLHPLRQPGEEAARAGAVEQHEDAA